MESGGLLLTMKVTAKYPARPLSGAVNQIFFGSIFSEFFPALPCWSGSCILLFVFYSLFLPSSFSAPGSRYLSTLLEPPCFRLARIRAPVWPSPSDQNSGTSFADLIRVQSSALPLEFAYPPLCAFVTGARTIHSSKLNSIIANYYSSPHR